MHATTLVVVAAAVLGVAVAGKVEMDPDTAELAAMVRENCVGEHGLDEGILAAVDGGGNVADHTDGNFKCYIKCTMEMGGMLVDGKVDLDTVDELLPASIRDKVAGGIHACGTQTGADDCDTAWLTQICWQKSNPNFYFLI